MTVAGCAGEPSEDGEEEDTEEPEEELQEGAEENSEEGPEHSATTVWEFEAENTFQATPAYHNGVLFVPNADARIYAIDAESGDEVWTTRLERDLRTTLATSNEAVFTPRDGEFNYALSQESGDVIWESDEHFFAGKPDYEDGKLFFTRSGINALDAETGRGLWEHELDVYATSPVMASNGLAVTRGPNGIHAVEQDDGDEVWNFRPDGEPYERGFQMSSEYVVFRADDDRIYVLDTDTGEQVTRISTGASDVTLVDGVIYYPDSELIAYGIESDEQLWAANHRLGSESLARSMIDGFLVFARRREGIGIIDISNGSVYEIHEFDWRPAERPLVIDDTMYLTDDSRSLYAFEIEIS